MKEYALQGIGKRGIAGGMNEANDVLGMRVEAVEEVVVKGVRQYGASKAELMGDEVNKLKGRARSLANLKGARRSDEVVEMSKRAAADEAERKRAAKEGAAQNVGMKAGMGMGLAVDGRGTTGPLMGMGEYAVKNGAVGREIYARKLPAEVYEYLSKGVNKNDILNDFWRIGQLPANRISEIFLEGEKPVGVVHQLMAKCWLRFLEEADASVLFKFADYLIGRGDKVKVAKMVGSVGAVYDAHEVDVTFSGVGGGMTATAVGDEAGASGEKLGAGGEFNRGLRGLGVKERLKILAAQRAIKEDEEVKRREEEDAVRAAEEAAAQASVKDSDGKGN